MTAEEAKKLAESIAQAQGWTWCGNVHAQMKRRWIFWGPSYWIVRSNWGCRGCAVEIHLDQSGKVLHQHFEPR
jgi:hypothetical protein